MMSTWLVGWRIGISFHSVLRLILESGLQVTMADDSESLVHDNLFITPDFIRRYATGLIQVVWAKGVSRLGDRVIAFGLLQNYCVFISAADRWTASWLSYHFLADCAWKTVHFRCACCGQSLLWNIYYRYEDHHLSPVCVLLIIISSSLFSWSSMSRYKW